MWKDPVVEEVRAIRDAYALPFDHDIEAICGDLRPQEQASGREVVTLPPKRIVSSDAGPAANEKAA
jgi:hypothetical protein